MRFTLIALLSIFLFGSSAFAQKNAIQNYDSAKGIVIFEMKHAFDSSRMATTDKGAAVLESLVRRLLTVDKENDNEEIKKLFSENAWREYQRYLKHQRKWLKGTEESKNLDKRHGYGWNDMVYPDHLNPKPLDIAFNAIVYSANGDFWCRNPNLTAITGELFKVTIYFENIKPYTIENLKIRNWIITVYGPLKLPD